MSNEPISGLPYQEAGSLQTDAVQNAELNYFTAWLNCVVLEVGRTVPSGSEVDGDRVIVGSPATGAFAGHEQELAVYRDGWQFYPALNGVSVRNLVDDADWDFDGAAWAVVPGGGSVTLDGLTDVNIAGRADGDSLTWDATTGKWVPSAITGGGGGALELVASVVVTGSAVTDIDFTGLDMDTDFMYQVEAYVLVGATGQHIISQFMNGDTTQGNYQRQVLSYSSSAPDIGRSNHAYIAHTADALGGTTQQYSFATKIKKKAGRKAMTRAELESVDSSGNVFIGETAMIYNGSTANVTDIKFRNSVTNGFGVGTVIRLYRVN